MRLRRDRARVRVSATSANLGPGFDSLGLALDLYDELEAEAVAGSTSVHVVGEGADSVPDDETHLVVRAIHRGLEMVGAPLVGVRLRCRNTIPHGRGMGSSAAAVVGGLALARAFVGEPDALPAETVLALATELEGHPDNAAPAIYGGLTVAWWDDDASTPRATRVPVDPALAPVVCVPTAALATALARTALPKAVPLSAAAFNLSRAALLVVALGGRPELLMDATEDRLHQEQRRPVMPATLDLVDRLRAAGIPAVVSGAGPSVLILARAENGVRLAPTVMAVRRIAGSDWTVGRCGVCHQGVFDLGIHDG